MRTVGQLLVQCRSSLVHVLYKHVVDAFVPALLCSALSIHVRIRAFHETNDSNSRFYTTHHCCVILTKRQQQQYGIQYRFDGVSMPAPREAPLKQ